MAPRVDHKQGFRGPGPAEDAAVMPTTSKRKAEEQALEAADQETHDAVARADVDDEDYDEDPAIWNLNRMARLNLMTPEWIENSKKNHYENVARMNRVYEKLKNDDGEVADEATMAEFDKLCNNIFANVDLTGLNTVGGESCGMDAVAVYPVDVYPPEEKDNDAAA